MSIYRCYGGLGRMGNNFRSLVDVSANSEKEAELKGRLEINRFLNNVLKGNPILNKVVCITEVKLIPLVTTSENKTAMPLAGEHDWVQFYQEGK